MNMKKQLALGGALLTATAAACLKLAQWAGKSSDNLSHRTGMSQ